ncbi:uncharacterized protein LOC129905216 isoform X2 [Episyrphus balteatus]|uniref:uncharacterized protein LOC129905216 isoform X2 n=1 Tax=Episyrphus balteatus TaxID=286459 RepID=UPI002485943F|nr:uncharacterized protein LOC129905216 isoform X2 [Episyrphus balteatus]
MIESPKFKRKKKPTIQPTKESRKSHHGSTSSSSSSSSSSSTKQQWAFLFIIKMGNICSSSQKNNKDAESEGSESDDSGSEYKSPRIDKADVKDLAEEMDKININELTHHPTCDEIDKITKLNVCSTEKINQIFKKPPDHYRKIVLNIITSNVSECKRQLSIINRFLPELSTHSHAKGFELIVSLTQNENLSKYKTDNLPHINWNENSLGTHEQLQNYLYEITRHKNSYIIPVLFFGLAFEKLQCPLKIKQKDFKFLLSITSKEQSELLQKYYKAESLCESSAFYSLCSYSSLHDEEAKQILETFITLMPINLKTTYLATPVEKIITNVILSSRELMKHCVWIQDNGSSELSQVSPSIKSEVSTRHLNLNCQLKDEINAKNIIPPYSSSDECKAQFDLIGDVLKSNIDNVIHEHLVKYNSRNTLGVCKPIADDIEAVKRYSIAIRDNYCSTYDLDGILRYIQSDCLFPLAVFATPEEGMDIFTSQIAFNLENLNQDYHLVVRYAHLTVVTTEITSLLASIADQISIIVAGKPCHSQHSLHNYKLTIERLLESSNLNIVIIIDSVDKLVGGTNFKWLPKISKPNAKIILTMTKYEVLTENLSAKELIKQGVPKENLLPVTTKKNNDKHSRSYLEAKLHEKLISFGVKTDNNGTENLIESLLIALETEIDVKFLEILLIIIAISPFGVYETDCISIFEEQTEIERWCSLIIWSKFCWLMGSMLIHTTNIRIMDSIFEDAVLKRYSKNIPKIQKAAMRYYENQPDIYYDSEIKLKRLNTEKYLKVSQYDRSILSGSKVTVVSERNEYILEEYFARQFFTDLSWISNKIACCGCFQYLYDITKAEETFKKSTVGYQHVELLKQFLTQHMTQLNYDGSQFYTFFKCFLKNSILTKESLNSNDYVKKWIISIDQLKTTHLENVSYDNDKQNSIFDGTKTYNEVVILKEPGYFVAAISTDCDEICVWDVHSSKIIRVLKSVPKPRLLCSIRNFEVAVLCNREIKVIDLDEGKYKATLKGVMNQKMPYFGLHDEDHLVCLSRNRMYVNLMNLKTGDCATSFKAGEDRFLNSLIVSGNGRILVCGDESQKPFSLLVWHLSQRRLLYDLRIPHHDLFTALSAITYEGLYVCVVAKEIREPAPNFIVVYDLQSGTLFQKLKPACNTVAIAISQANGCVIAGLENADILIWDLVTGNCRHTLSGHNAPATLMKLDPLGKCLLSGDKDGRDLSLRLWELSTGKSLAVYTPPQKISSCEMLDNGAFIIIAMEEAPDILILKLKNNTETRTQTEIFTQKIVECKVHILNEN